jgi:GMP synthase-like glutamine amidotransferase
MSVLICKNIESEGPGTIEAYLKRQKISYKIIELSRGESIPNQDNFDVLVMMGGPMSVNPVRKSGQSFLSNGVNEDKSYSYIREEVKLVRDFISKGKKIFGICLGAQIMAKALGAKVYLGSEKEIGWYEIKLTEDGLRDPYMRNLALHPEISGELSRKFQVFHWHGETFDIPEGAVRLASSELYPNQAFRYGENAYAFQFHIEVTPEIIKEWFENEKDFDIDNMLNQTNREYAEYHKRALKFYENFFS